MKLLLPVRSLPALLRAAGDKLLLAFDFDGTLAPIVSRPADAQMRPRTRRLLRQVARLYPCVVISGRGRADIGRKVAGIPLGAVVGNHGIESEGVPPAARRLVVKWRVDLQATLGPSLGVELEDKGATLALHYRNSPRPAAACRAILAAVASLPRVRIVKGKMVVDLLPAGAPNKATAVRAQLRRARCRSAIYVGDDQTDEDVFALAGRAPIIGIRIGRRRGSGAEYYLRGQRDIDALLSALIGARTPV